MRHVLVVGAGLAGLAAAWAAKKMGARVTIVRGRPGASALSSGAWDWEIRRWSVDDPGMTSVLDFLRETRAPVLHGDAIVVGSSGVRRSTGGRDVQVLDVGNVERVVVPRVAVGAWDADAIAESIDARAIDATLVKHEDEMRMPLADFAALHDDEARRAWLVDRLRESLAHAPDADAVLLPPMLGVDEKTIEHVRAAISIAVGESLCDPGGPRALRFVRWRDAALRALEVEVVDGDVARVAATSATFSDGRSLSCDAIVLAIGGLVAGGLSLASLDDRQVARVGVDIDAPEITVFSHGEPLDPPASLFGHEGHRLILGASSLLDRAGVPIERSRVCDRRGRALSWLFAAGDVVADAPRSAMNALTTGIAAGSAAAASP